MPIDERREMVEAIRASRQSRPDAWPPPVKEGVGSSFGPPAPPPNFRHGVGVDAVHKLFSGVWGIIVILAGAFGGGMAFNAMRSDQPTKADIKSIADKLEELKKAEETNQTANQTTFATVQSDIRWLKDMNRVQAEEPIKTKKR